MNFLDVFLTTVLLFGFIKGIYKGLFVELASLISLLVGLYIAVKFSGLIAGFWKEESSQDPYYIEVIAFASTFILVVIGITLLAKVFTKIANFTALGWLNRLLGGFFGLIKILFILSVILHFFQKINLDEKLLSEEKLSSSVLFNPVKTSSDFIFPILSKWFTKAQEEVELPVTIKYEEEV